MPTVLLHFQNDDPVMGELDELPKPTDSLIIVQNPRRRDGKDLPNMEPNVTAVMYPVARLMYVEIISSGAEEEIIGFVRE
jgi:hypothetical protein